MRNVIIYAILFLGLQCTVCAQLLESLDRKVKRKVTVRVENNVDQIIDKGLDKAEADIKNENSKKPGVADNTSQPKDQETAAQKNTDKPQGKVISNSRYDFIPGEKILYAEDFSDGAIGEIPANWNASGNGQVVTIDGFEGKWLRMFPGSKYLSGNEKEPGENYTIEFDVLLDGTPPSGTRFLPDMAIGLFSSSGKPTTDNAFLLPYSKPNNVIEMYFRSNIDAISTIRLESKKEHGTPTFKSEDLEVPAFGKTIGKSVHYAIQVQKQRLRFWIDGAKIFDVPRAVNLSPALNQLYFNIKEYWPYNESNYGMYVSNIKIAAGLPDMRGKLMDAGKFSTTGILFDVNSDRIQPQSYGTIQAISQILKENTGIRIKIIGHTDSDGESAANMLLSRKRAAAVKSLLEKDFGIESAKMETDGKGESEPATGNSSNEFKAMNRRVEFIKI